MATNATLTWIPQSNLVAQEAWYGALSAVGATLPPATGWNPGANLYSAIANSATFNNLNENTQYQFAVRSIASTGDSSWAMLTGYKFTCPTVSTTVSSTSVGVTLTTLNPAALSAIVNTLSLSLIEVSSGTTVSTVNYSGSQIVSPLVNTFTGLTSSDAYNAVVSYTLTNGGPSTICSTTAVTTSAPQTCPQISFSITNVTTTGFTVTPIGLQAGDTYDISLTNGASYPYINATQPSMSLNGLTSGSTYTVVIRRDCANTLNSVSASQQVTLITNNFTVVDVWYNCTGGGATCAGQAIWATNVTIRQTSNGAVVYTYANNPSVPNGFTGFVPGLVTGTQYTLTASWAINASKTIGFSAVFLTGNGVSQNWSPTGNTVTESINFIAAATNNIQVASSSRGSLCPPFC